MPCCPGFVLADASLPMGHYMLCRCATIELTRNYGLPEFREDLKKLYKWVMCVLCAVCVFVTLCLCAGGWFRKSVWLGAG